MATYRINLPATSGTITAATRSKSCISTVSIDTSSDPYPIISTTALTGDDVTITYNANTSMGMREHTYPVTYTRTNGMCTDNEIHLVQAASDEPIQEYNYYLSLTSLNQSLFAGKTYAVYIVNDFPSTDAMRTKLMNNGSAIGRSSKTATLGKITLEKNPGVSTAKYYSSSISNKLNLVYNDSNIVNGNRQIYLDTEYKVVVLSMQDNTYQNLTGRFTISTTRTYTWGTDVVDNV